MPALQWQSLFLCPTFPIPITLILSLYLPDLLPPLCKDSMYSLLMFCYISVFLRYTVNSVHFWILFSRKPSIELGTEVFPHDSRVHLSLVETERSFPQRKSHTSSRKKEEAHPFSIHTWQLLRLKKQAEVESETTYMLLHF